ncbi:MAG: DUF6090 family protein [Bacteroidota bacterium]
MIQLFRRIRQRLLSENKFSKYLLYAVGEIILVVIGILIALSANNYNEDQKALKQSGIYLNDMLEDLTSDTLYLYKMLEVLQNQLEIEEWLLNKETFNKADIDSIKLSVSNVNWTFSINDRSFQNIQNSNDAKLFGYEELYSEISKYYLISKDRIAQNNQLENQMNNNQSEFEQLINKNLLISNKQYQDYHGFKIGIEMPNPSLTEYPEQIIASLSTIQTRNTLNEKYARHNFIYLNLFLCDLEAKKLIKKIKGALGDDKSE